MTAAIAEVLHVSVPVAAGGLPPDGSLGVIDTATDAETYFFNPSWLGERFYSAAVTPDNTKLYAIGLIYPPDVEQILVFNPITVDARRHLVN